MFPSSWGISKRAQRDVWLFLISFCFSQMNSILFSGSILSSYTIFLGGDDLTVSLLSGTVSFCCIFQIVGALLTKRSRTYNSVIKIWASIGRLCFVPVAFIPYLMPNPSSGRIACIVILTFLTNGFVQFTCPPWISMTSILVNDKIGGRYVGLRSSLSMVVCLVTGLVTPLFLDAYGGTLCYAIIISLAAFAGIGDTSCYYFVSEVEVEPREREVDLWTSVKNSLADKKFRKILVFKILWTAVNNLPAASYTMYMLTTLGLNVFTAMLVQMIPQYIGKIVFAGKWGARVDKFGVMRSWYAAQFGDYIPIIAWILVGPSNCFGWLLFTHILCSWFLTGTDAAACKQTIYDLPEGDKLVSSSLATIGSCVLGTFFPALLGGALVVWFRSILTVNPAAFVLPINEYQALFIISLTVKLLAHFFLMPWVNGDKHMKPGEIYRDVWNEIKSNILLKLLRKV